MHYNFEVLTRKLLLKVVTKVEILNYFWSCTAARLDILISFCLHSLYKLRLKCYTLTPKSWPGSKTGLVSDYHNITHSPVICKDIFSLVHMYKSSRQLYLISIWVLFSLSQHLSKALKPAPLQPIKHLAYISSDFLDYPLSPLIAIHIHFILYQINILLLKGHCL